MRSGNYAGVAVLWVLCYSKSIAGSDLIRTFVNGTGKPVHDLHIEYDTASPLTGYAVLGSPPLPSVAPDPHNGKQLNVVWNPTLASGASITIKADTDAGAIGISEWWWTDQNSNMVGKANGPTVRGDESSHGAANKLPQNDTYSIVNKGHHWGGADRTNSQVTINMYLKKFLAQLNAADQASALADIKAAIKQWTDCTNPQTQGQVPKAGQGNDPSNHGEGMDPPVMAPGPTHKGQAKGKKFRSLTIDECNAIFVKYPKGLQINVVTTNDLPAGQEGIQVNWGVPPDGGGAKGYGPSEPDPTKKDRTSTGEIDMQPPSKVKWHYGQDTDGDGYITNADTDNVPNDSYDFYSIFKHELGHVLCFNHSGQNFDDQDPHFAVPVPSSSGTASGGPCPGCGTPNGTSTGDGDDDDPGTVYFSSDQPGGFGGLDIWRAWWNGTNWVQENLGPGVNTPYDETDPFLASDGTTLLFSSDRPDSIGGFDLYESIYDLQAKVWSQAQNLGTLINTPSNERHPSLTADMKSLFLVSDQPGGLGGWDVWGSEFIWDQGWSECYNLGAAVNSPDNEVAACINASGDGLVIASDRPGGMGGLDLWLSTNGSGWSNPVNLGPAINSPANESDPSFRSDHAYLLFTSDRNPGGDTIYESYMRLPIQTYSNWVADWFSPSNISNPEITGPFADPDQDGVPNLLDYAFASNPLLGQGSAGPTVYTLDTTNGTVVEFLFARPLLGYDLTYRIEVSPDLQTWHYNGDVPGAVYTDTVETVPSIDVEAIRFRPHPGLEWPALFCRIAVQWGP